MHHCLQEGILNTKTTCTIMHVFIESTYLGLFTTDTFWIIWTHQNKFLVTCNNQTFFSKPIATMYVKPKCIRSRRHFSWIFCYQICVNGMKNQEFLQAVYIRLMVHVATVLSIVEWLSLIFAIVQTVLMWAVLIDRTVILNLILNKFCIKDKQMKHLSLLVCLSLT